MALPPLPPETSTGWYAHYAAIDAAVRTGADLYKPGVTDINATGTRSSTTYLRGDGTWAVPPGTATATVDTSKLEAVVFHNGTAGGGTRPTGYARVLWVGGTAQPGNMLDGDTWEHDA